MSHNENIAGRRNITVEPSAKTSAVEQPEITHVISLRSGRMYESTDLIQSIRYDRWIRLRRQNAFAIRAKTPMLICQICHTPVRFALSPQKRAFFRHAYDEDGSCPAITRSGRTQNDYREMVYRGQQESRLHRETKNFIAECLELDPDFREVLVEQTWKARDGATLRRPDVRAIGPGNLQIAFEAQLTTTFLDVVVARSAFYAAEGGHLVWVLRQFDPNYRRATEDDIFFPNNSNAIVVDSTTAAASRAARRFLVRVHHRTISSEGHYGWTDALVPFAALTFDTPGQRTFAYDFEDRERVTLAAIQKRTIDTATAEEADRHENLRRSAFTVLQMRSAEAQHAWDNLRNSLEHEGIPTPGIASDVWVTAPVINALASAREGKVIGFAYKHLIEIANYLHTHQRGAVRAFLALIDENGHRRVLQSAGNQAKWQLKEAQLAEDAERGNPSARLPQALRKLVFFLFPTLTRGQKRGSRHESTRGPGAID